MPPPGGPPPGPSACATRAVGARSAILTREQYVNAASDLLGFDVRSLATFSDVGGRKATQGTSLSALQVEERQSAAEAIAAAAVTPANLAKVVACDLVRTGEPACATQLVDRIGLRAFRRPLTTEARAALRRLFDAGAAGGGGFAGGVEWLLAGVLQSPDFTYQLVPRPTGPNARPGAVVALDDHALASRLSFFVWNSGPDADLLAAAAAGTLRTAAGVASQVQRLLRDPRAARMREDYYSHWLHVDSLGEISRDAREFTPVLAADLRRSAMQSIHALYQSGAKLDDLLGGSTLFMNDALARVYGVTPLPGGADLKPVAFKADERHGILTHPALMALLSEPGASDPIKRGVFVAEELFCATVPDPIPDIPDLPAQKPGVSTRQRLEMHRTAPACAICHRLFDPIGMAFENFDPIGRFRATDQGVAVDSSGELAHNTDIDGPFPRGMDFLRKLSASKSVRDCAVKRWYEHAMAREVDPAEDCPLEPVRARFRASGNLVELVASIAESEMFRYQQVGQE